MNRGKNGTHVGEGKGAQLIKKRAITRQTDEPKKGTRLTILTASTWGKPCIHVYNMYTCRTNQVLQRLQDIVCLLSLSYPTGREVGMEPYCHPLPLPEGTLMQRGYNLHSLPHTKGCRMGEGKEWIPGLTDLSLLHERFARKVHRNRTSERAKRGQRKRRKEMSNGTSQSGKGREDKETKGGQETPKRKSDRKRGAHPRTS